MRRRIGTALAFWLIKRAGRCDSRSVELFAFNYCAQNSNDYLEWTINKAMEEYGIDK